MPNSPGIVVRLVTARAGDSAVVRMMSGRVATFSAKNVSNV